MVHAGELKGALKVCRFHTRDPPVKNSGHTSRESAWVRFYLISRGKKHERKKINNKNRERLSPERCRKKTTLALLKGSQAVGLW